MTSRRSFLKRGSFITLAIIALGCGSSQGPEEPESSLSVVGTLSIDYDISATNRLDRYLRKKFEAGEATWYDNIVLLKVFGAAARVGTDLKIDPDGANLAQVICETVIDAPGISEVSVVAVKEVDIVFGAEPPLWLCGPGYSRGTNAVRRTP